jgi:hypothetical protein
MTRSAPSVEQEDTTQQQKKPGCDGNTFPRLLALFDLNPEIAGAKYNKLHLNLTRIFRFKQVPDPEAKADEVFDRICAKIAKGEVIEDIEKYARKVAQYVHLESLRQPTANQWDDDVPEPVDKDEGPLNRLLGLVEAREMGHIKECFSGCLKNRLSESDRSLISQYYINDEDHNIDESQNVEDKRLSKIRVELAQELGLSRANLRQRATRIRRDLYECVEECKRKGKT